MKLTYLGKHWEWSGDLFRMRHPNGNHATVFVDSLGELWVDIRRIPEDGWFPSERVKCFRVFLGSKWIENKLREDGYSEKSIPQYAHRVRERDA